ncbi:MAG: hypothetical protein ACYTAF_12095, partial [Planctomycetota bacterium]|jgi:hypothetical protein
MVELHLSVGLYRIVVKWGLWSRKFQHAFHWVQLAVFLVIAYVALYMLYEIGARTMTAGGF